MVRYLILFIMCVFTLSAQADFGTGLAVGFVAGSSSNNKSIEQVEIKEEFDGILYCRYHIQVQGCLMRYNYFSDNEYISIKEFKEKYLKDKILVTTVYNFNTGRFYFFYKNNR